MPEIVYVVGDATIPIGDGPRIIAHVANDIGAWGAGFSGAISRRWNAPEQDYRAWYARSGRKDLLTPFGLGQSWQTPVGDGLYVVSMIAQHGIRGPRNPAPIRYNALWTCLERLAHAALLFGLERPASVHMPRIGCGLAGGTWDRVEPLIVEHLVQRGVPVTVYDLPERQTCR